MGSDVVVRQIGLGSLDASTPGGVLDVAKEVATPLAKLIEDRQLYKAISGRKYVLVDGWACLAAMLGVMPQEESVEEKDNGDWLAVVRLIRVRDAVVLGRASSICGMDETTWAKRDRYARRSMAVTRATGKACRLAFSWIIHMAGFEGTPFEEMPAAEQPKGVKPPQQKPAPPKPPIEIDAISAVHPASLKVRLYQAMVAREYDAAYQRAIAEDLSIQQDKPNFDEVPDEAVEELIAAIQEGKCDDPRVAMRARGMDEQRISDLIQSWYEDNDCTSWSMLSWDRRGELLTGVEAGAWDVSPEDAEKAAAERLG